MSGTVPLLPAALWLADPWHDALALILAFIVCRPVADLIRLAAGEALSGDRKAEDR